MQLYYATTNLRTALPPDVRRCPCIGTWEVIDALGLPHDTKEWPMLTTANVQSICTRHVPVGWDGPVMWNDEGRHYRAMLTANGVEQNDGERFYEGILDKARASRSKAKHGIYIAQPHTWGEGDYRSWLANTGPDKSALEAYRISRIRELADEPGTCMMGSVYCPGISPDWTLAQNVQETTRYGMDCLSRMLEIKQEFGHPVYAIIAGRLVEKADGSPGTKLMEELVIAQIEAAKQARPLDNGAARVDGVILWSGEGSYDSANAAARQAWEIDVARRACA